MLDAHRERHNNNRNHGTFGIKCLTCTREVEKIHISRNGDIHIIKTQQSNGQHSENENQYQLWRQREQQVQMEEIMQRRIQRTQQRHRCQYCKNKLCSICFGILMFGTILTVFLRSYY